MKHSEPAIIAEQALSQVIQDPPDELRASVNRHRAPWCKGQCI